LILADGAKKSLPVGEARLTYNGVSAPCLVVFAPEEAEPLFGALALESLGLEADPVNRRLKPATLYLA
jgi:predicted aspartyl protease